MDVHVHDGEMATAGSCGSTSTTAGADSGAKPKRNDLSLKVKYEVIKVVEPKIGIHKLDQILSKMNGTLRVSGCSVLLLMDNAGCHPEELRHKFTNVKIVFLPANTTSAIRFGNHQKTSSYGIGRKLLFRHVLAKIEDCMNVSEVTKSLTILHAIKWVAEAWKQLL